MKMSAKKSGCFILVLALLTELISGYQIRAEERGELEYLSSCEFENHKYYYFDYSLSWSEAEEYCESIGGHLATITSQKEQDILIELTSSATKKNAWIGAHAVDGEYCWVTGEKFEYSNWAPGEPNNVFNTQFTTMMYLDKASYDAGLWNDENENGRSWSGYYLSDFGFICEIGEPELQSNMALTMDQVWGFSNAEAISGGLEYKHYLKFFGPGFSGLGYAVNQGYGGLCAGMVTSAIAISGHDAPPVESFVLSNGNHASKLHDVKSVNDYSMLNIFNRTTAADYVKYAYVYQNTPLTQLEKSLNKNQLDKLYNAVKSSINGTGEYVEISVRGEIDNQNEGHTLLAMGIGINNDIKTEILVYDCNIVDELQIVTLFKTNGEYTAWSFEPSYLQWGSGKKYSEISYTTSGNDFARDMFSNHMSSASLENYKLLISAKENHITLFTNNGNKYELNGNNSEDLEILKVQTDSLIMNNAAKCNGDNLYWIKESGELKFENGNQRNFVSVANENKVISSDISNKAILSLNVSEVGRSIANLDNISKGSTFSVTYEIYKNEVKNSIKIQGTSYGDKIETSENNGIVEINGADYLLVDFENGGGGTNHIEIDADGQNVQLEKDVNGEIKVSAGKGGNEQNKAVNNEATKLKTISMTKRAKAKVVNQKTTTIKKVTAKKKSIKVSWKKKAGVNGYQIQYSRSKKFKNAKRVTIKKAKITSKTLKKLNAKKKYYVIIRTYIVVNGKKYYSNWSKKRSKKTK